MTIFPETTSGIASVQIEEILEMAENVRNLKKKINKMRETWENDRENWGNLVKNLLKWEKSGKIFPFWPMNLEKLSPSVSPSQGLTAFT